MAEHRNRLFRDSLFRLVRRGAWAHVARLLERARPADIAELLDRLTETDRSAVFHQIPSDDVRAEVLALLEFVEGAHLVAALEAGAAARLVSRMAPDEAAALLREIPRQSSDEILGALGDGAEEIESLLGYTDETAGAIMSTEYVALPEAMTVRGAIDHLQARSATEASFYVYVIDDRGSLVGVLSLRQLIVQSADKHLRDFMVPDPIRVSTDTDQELVARQVARYDLLAIPVVDLHNLLVGVVTVDDVIDVLREEATEDILKMAGTTVEEVSSPHPLRSAWIRSPWLAAAFVGELGGIFLLGNFQNVLAQTVQLAFFLPIVLAMGGNVGSQCAMLMVRGLATGRLEPGSLGPVIARQLATSLILAAGFGVILAGLAVALGYGPRVLPVVVGMGISASILMAAGIGTMLPPLLARLGADPAVASGPFVTTSIDIVGIGVFFSVAQILL